MSEKDRISRAEAAKILGVHVQTVDRYADAGRLHRDKNSVTQRVTFSREQVEELRRERAGTP